MEARGDVKSSPTALSNFLSDSGAQTTAVEDYKSRIDDGGIDIRQIYRDAELSTSSLLAAGPYLLPTKRPKKEPRSKTQADGIAMDTDDGMLEYDEDGSTKGEGEEHDEEQVDEDKSESDIDSEGYFTPDDDTMGNTSEGDLVIKGAVKGNILTLHEFLGAEYTQRINELQKVEPLADNAYMPTSPLEHQRSGTAKCVKLVDGPNHGGILADEMGLGKTLCALWTAMTVKDRVPGAFSLVVTTKTCIIQWAETCQLQFPPDRQPKIKILDKHTTAIELIASGYDLVLCSYGMLRYQHKVMVDYEIAFGQREAKPSSDGKIPKAKAIPTRRPILSLFSPVYRDLGLPIKVLILDEVQYAKNPKGFTHAAIKALWYDKILMLSGTFLANRWSDVYGVLDFLPGHPFDTLQKFRRYFASRVGGKWGDPEQIQIHRLQKLLMAITISRPDSLLNLPGKIVIVRRFRLSEEESENVLKCTKQYLEMIQAIKGGDEKAQKEGYAELNQENKKLFAAAQRAQQHAANPLLLPEKELAKSSRDRRVVKAIENIRKLAEKEMGKDEIDDSGEVPPPDDNEAGEAEQRKLKYQERLMNAMIAVIQNGGRSIGATNEDLVGTGDDDDHDDFEDDVEDDEDYLDDFIHTTGRGRDARRWKAKVRAMTDKELFSSRVQCFLDVFDEIGQLFPGEKIIVFSKFLKFLDLCEEALKRRHNIYALRFDGSTSIKDRQLIKAIFDKSEETRPVFITPGAGGAGLNMASASKMIVCEPWWNGNDHKQAHRRMYRYGQVKICHVWQLVAANSAIDVLIQNASNKKLVINDEIMGPLRRLDDEEPKIPTIARYY